MAPQKVSNEECQEECLEFIQVMWLKHKYCFYTLIPELTVKKWRKEVFEYFLKIAHTHKQPDTKNDGKMRFSHQSW